MLVHQHSDTMISSSNSSKVKKRRMLRNLPQSSPLLLISSKSKSMKDLTSPSLKPVDEDSPDVLEVSPSHIRTHFPSIILTPRAQQAKNKLVNELKDKHKQSAVK